MILFRKYLTDQIFSLYYLFQNDVPLYVNIGNPDADFQLMGTLTPEERAAQSMKRAEKNGEVIDLCNL